MYIVPMLKFSWDIPAIHAAKATEETTVEIKVHEVVNGSSLKTRCTPTVNHVATAHTVAAVCPQLPTLIRNIIKHVRTSEKPEQATTAKMKTLANPW
mmetsp:Transcript_10277/g.17234  ORF Transcript_10277/g.17234 Transcript_10277/m.17234 type:complete len:97 (+) Transcript_10277:444-734(+)